MRRFLLIVGIGATLAAGCHSLDSPCSCSHARGPDTLLAWEVGSEKDEEGEEKKRNNSGEQPDAAKKQEQDGNGSTGHTDEGSGAAASAGGDATKKTLGANGNGGNGGDGGNGDGAGPEEPRELASDRPDFTEASTTVGRGRVQLETGYTYSRNQEAGVSSAHSFPETLLRVGLFAEWFELRLGQNYSRTRGVNPDGTRFRADGLQDFYVGSKLALTEQKGYLPETAVILFATVPTAREGLTADRTLPGVSLLYGWDVIDDCLTLAGSTLGSAAVDDAGHDYLELAQSVTLGYTLTDRLGAYTEVFGFFPHGAVAPGVGAQYYFNGGFTYRLTPDVQYDVRAGVGLNRQSDDYFLGSGIVVRY